MEPMVLHQANDTVNMIEADAYLARRRIFPKLLYRFKLNASSITLGDCLYNYENVSLETWS